MMRVRIGRRLVVATHNAGKLEEMVELLAPHGVEVVSAAALGLPVPEETESTFVGNARIKAHAAARLTGLPSLADDSGLEVDGLGGAPGVYSADWAETSAGRDFDRAMSRVWSELERAGAAYPRNARFRCALVLATPDGEDAVFEGALQGRIVWPRRDSLGYGYDPIFQPDGYEETLGEMARSEKNRISHRAEAFRKLMEECFT